MYCRLPNFLIAPTICHPDVGAIYGSRGYLDFYIDSDIQLGFELLRNGVRLNGHLDRFDPENGLYNSIPLHDYAVIDFYQAEHNYDINYQDQEKYYAAVFSADLKSIRLWHKGLVTEISCV